MKEFIKMIIKNYENEGFDKIDDIECRLRSWIDGHEELQQNLSEILNCILSKRLIIREKNGFLYFGSIPNGSDKSHSDLFLKKDSSQEWYFPIVEVKTSLVLPTEETPEIIEK